MTSVITRLAGDGATADLLAMGYLAALTATLSKDSGFRAVTAAAGSCVRLQPWRDAAAAHPIRS
jgi:hypothetical protein